METTQILRIKRRRRDEHETLDALVIQAPHKPAKRLRKSEDDVEDSKNNDSQSMNSSNGIFRFAATVSPSTFTTEASKRSLRERITSLILHPPPRAGSSSASVSSTPSSAHRQSKFSVVDNSPIPSGSATPTSAALQQQEKARKQARYKIVQEKRSYPSSPSGAAGSTKTSRRVSPRRPTAPPIVRSTAPSSSTEDPSKEEFRILEAAIESDSSDDDDDPIRKQMKAYADSQSNSRSRATSNKKLRVNRLGRIQSNQQQQEDDEMMSNFVPMLQEYLSLGTPTLPAQAPPVSTASPLHFQSSRLPSSFHAPAPRPKPSKSSTSTLPTNTAASPSPPSQPSDTQNEVTGTSPVSSSYYPPDLSSGDAGDSDSEYVYDVYYRDSAPAPTPTSSTELSSTTSYLDQTEYNPYATEGLTRIGALTGLEDDELLYTSTGGKVLSGKSANKNGGESDDSDEDMVNTDDEDSNEEDFYRNDYPEGEGESDDSGDGHDQRMYAFRGKARGGGSEDDGEDEEEEDF